MDTFDTQIGNVYNVSRAIAEQWKYIKEHAKQGVSVTNMEVVNKVLTADNFSFAFKTLYSDGSSTITPAIVIPVFKGEKGDQGEQGEQGLQGEQGISVTDVEVIPQVSDDQGILYHIETTLSNGTKINSGDFLVPKGDKGDKGDNGIGIEEIENGTPTVNGEYTYTPITVRYTDQSTQNFEIPAKNGENGIVETPEMINLDNNPADSINVNTLTDSNTYSFSRATRLTNLPDNTVTYGMLQVFQGEEYLDTTYNVKFRQLRQTLYAYKNSDLVTAYRAGDIVTDKLGSPVFTVGQKFWSSWTSAVSSKLYQHNISISVYDYYAQNSGYVNRKFYSITLKIITKSEAKFTYTTLLNFISTYFNYSSADVKYYPASGSYYSIVNDASEQNYINMPSPVIGLVANLVNNEYVLRVVYNSLSNDKASQIHYRSYDTIITNKDISGDQKAFEFYFNDIVTEI